MEKVDDVTLLKKRAVSGVLALTSRNFLLYLISAASYLTLGAYLTRSDFGVYAAVTAVMKITSYFTNFGFGAAIVQKKEEITQSELTSAFSTQAAVTFFIFILFWLNRNLLTTLMHLSEKGMMLLLVLIFTVFLSSFKTIPAVLLERKLKFDKVVYPQIAENLVFNVLLIILAINNFGIESFTYATLVSAVIGIPVYFLVSPWRISFGFKLSSFRILIFGALFQAKGIIAAIKDDFLTTLMVISKLLDFTSLGLINWWQKWAFFPFRFIVDSVTQVSFSAYARLQHDKLLLKKAVEKSLFGVSLLLFPILATMMVSAPYVVKFIPRYRQWEGGLLTFYFFCLNAGVSALSNILVNVLDATGKVKTTLKLMVFWTALIWLLTIIFVSLWGFNGFAAASFLVTLTIGLTVHLVKKTIQFNFFSSFYRPFLGTVFTAAVMFLYNKAMVFNMFHLLISLTIGAIIYTIFILVSCRYECLEFIRLLKRQK